MHRFGSSLTLAFMLGCGPGLVAEGGETGTGSTTGDGDGDGGDGDGDGDGDSGGDGDGDGDAGDGDGGDGDGDGGDGDGDGDGDGQPDCGDGQLACPDGTCQPDLDVFPCCGHDGACQEASCPFEMPLGPTSVVGTTAYGPNEQYVFGAFGLIFGEGPVNLSIALGTNLVTLGNHLWNSWDPPPSVDVLVVWGGNPVVGQHDVYVSAAIPLSEGAMGTLTITDIATDGDYPDHGLWATLEVAEGEWNLSGEIAIPGCQRLEQHLP